MDHVFISGNSGPRWKLDGVASSLVYRDLRRLVVFSAVECCSQRILVASPLVRSRPVCPMLVYQDKITHGTDGSPSLVLLICFWTVLLRHISTGHSLDLSFLRLFIKIHMAIHRAPRSLDGEISSPVHGTLLIVWFFIPLAASFTTSCMHESRIYPIFTLASTVALPPLAWSLCLLKQRQFPLSVSSLQHLSNIDFLVTCISVVFFPFLSYSWVPYILPQ